MNRREKQKNSKVKEEQISKLHMRHGPEGNYSIVHNFCEWILICTYCFISMKYLNVFFLSDIIIIVE